MIAVHRRATNDEHGAALALGVVFMVVIGAIAMATLAMINTGLNNRKSLDQVRDREYAAGGAIDYAIAQLRTLNAPNGGPAIQPCGLPASYTLGGRDYHVNCDNVPTTTFSGFLQRNIIFSACEGTSPCTDANTIVRAQVNFQAIGAGAAPIVVTRTWVQSWSVNR